MSDEWSNGYRAGYDAGYIAASNHYIRNQREEKTTQIHDPGYHENNFPGLSSTQISALSVQDLKDFDSEYSTAYGHAMYRRMKKEHEFK